MKNKQNISILDQLYSDGHLKNPKAKVVPLTGGVSSDIYLIEDGSNKWVVKRALEKLKVKEDWFADTSRNHFEHEYLKYVGAFLPEAVPRLIFTGAGYFAMEYLGEDFSNWKQLMLGGHYDPDHALRAGKILGIIHRTSQGDAAVRKRFDSTANFHQLRSSPYLVTTGRRHPDLTALFNEEVMRLESTRDCLVHGDYSPKNLLVSKTRMVAVDCEVAWYGDPAFDLAFLLTHLHLKAVHNPKAAPLLASMVKGFLASYISARVLDDSENAEIIQRLQRLLPMILLARIDGKSPVEYLEDEPLKEWVRRSTRQALLTANLSLTDFSDRWFSEITQIV